MNDLVQNIAIESSSTIPITTTQQLMLTGQLLQPNDPLYNMVMVFNIEGKLSFDCFSAAFACLVNNCDAMRIVFTSIYSQAQQHILETIEYDLIYLDFSDQSDPFVAYKLWEEKRKKRNFDLSVCLFDSAIVKLSEHNYIWYFNQHHLATDAWSTELIYRYVSSCYSLAKENRLHDAPTLPKYADYAHFEKTIETSKRFQRAEKYWSQKLDKTAGLSSFYRQVPNKKSSTTLRHVCDFGSLRSNKFRELLKQQDFAAFSNDLGLMQLFATVMYSYLHRITNNSCLAIGTPCHSRTSQKLKQTAGALINVFPLQVDIDDNETFASLYKKVAKANQELLINAIPGANQTPNKQAFDVVLNYLTASFAPFDNMPIAVSWEHPDAGDRNHLMRLQVQNFVQSEAITLFFDLNVDAFQKNEAQWVITHFLSLADAFLSDPYQAIAGPSLLSSLDLQDINSVQISEQYSAVLNDNESILSLLKSSFAQNMNNVALVCAEAQLSYAELDSRSDLIAHYLLNNGMVKSVPIAVFMERSIDAISTILGILKAGACFLPIDIHYPKSRVMYLLDNAKVDVVISSTEQQEILPKVVSHTILIDADWPRIESTVAVQKLPEVASSDSAYVIYTSGSTGQPKGVELGHRGLCNYINWAKHYYLAGEALDFGLFSSLSFDLTITSIFLPLTVGGKIVIYPESQVAPGMTIRNVIEDNRVDIIKLTPAHLSLIQNMDFSLSSLKKLIVGGDDFKTELAQSFDKYFAGNIEIYNEYGPTEATVACIVHKFDSLKDKGVSVPIGKPIANTRINILDSRLNPVPQGVVGEIYIGGEGLAKGYLHNTELSNERFITYRGPNKRLRFYRTGDLASYDEHGNIAYLGRNDHQVKIHGVRIETGEIESAMLSLAQVNDVIVDLASRFGLENPDESYAIQVEHCQKCGLAANHPSAQLDDEKICRICRIYEKQSQQAQAYYQDLPSLQARIDRIKSSSKGKQDSIMLLSGGKDSSYTLCKLVDMGLTPLVFTLDNGYISDGAKANIQRLVDRLGLELIVGQTEAMDDIFVDSLTRFSNVCNGCFKTIYTMSMKLAKERGISVICTGLSRGQIFETRVAHLFQQGCFSPEKIDERIIEARKAYHRADDIISRRLDVKVFQDDDIFEQVQYLDYFRYADVTLDEIYDYLENIAPWIRPSDTGRSTNCLINDAGIYVHKKERGYHNYALPYSWDVRLGHKERNAALDELNDEIDQQKVDDILKQVGYQQTKSTFKLARENALVAYYCGPAEIQKNTIQRHLAETLPKEYIPSQFIWLPELPLSSNGKIDRNALPKPQQSTRELNVDYAAPSSEVESILAKLWGQLLGIKEVGIADNFFDLGGDSIVNIQIVSAARELGINISPQQVFDYPTIEALASVADKVELHEADQGKLIASVGLSPIQEAFFEINTHHENTNTFAQSVTLAFTEDFSLLVFKRALHLLCEQHDALRARFSKTTTGWEQEICAGTQVHIEQLSLHSNENFDESITAQRSRLINTLNIEDGLLVAATHIVKPEDEKQYLLLVIHHLVIDGVSWWILLKDLALLCQQINHQQSVKPTSKTCSVRQWHDALSNYIESQDAQLAREYWIQTYQPKPRRLEKNLVQQRAVYHSRLSQQDTRLLLQQVPSAYKIQVSDVLITALNLCLPWFVKEQIIDATDDLVIDIEGHGREDIVKGIDISRTIAWFTSIYPMVLKAPTDSLEEVLRETKENLRSIPNNGIDYGLLRYLSPNQIIRDTLGEHPQAQILFNYMGQWNRTLDADSPFTFVYPISAHHGENTCTKHPLELNAMIYDNQLHIDFTYDSAAYSSEALEELSTKFKLHLRALIEYCISHEGTGFTPSDFKSADIGQSDLDDLFAEFGED